MTQEEYPALRARMETHVQAGLTVDQLAALAASEDWDAITIIRLLRELYGLSLSEASSASIHARHGIKYAPPHDRP